MSEKLSPASKKFKAKTSSKKTTPKTDADKIRALEEQLAQRDAELAVINSIQTALASKLDFQGIIDVVGDKLSQIFQDGNVGFAFLNKVRDIITFPYIIENGKRIEYFELALAQSGLMQHILKRRRPVIIHSKFGERFEGVGTFTYPGRDQRDLKSWVTVPIFNGTEIIGGASLRSWDRENAFSESDIRLLQTIVNSMSVAIQNVRLFDETQRLLKETEQRATELQIINNIGQTLTDGLDLNSTLEQVGERLLTSLMLKNIGIVVFDPKSEPGISHYLYVKGKRVNTEHFSLEKFKASIRLSLRGGGRSWVVNTNAEKVWRKYGAYGDEIAKSFVMLPLLAGKEVIGGITILDYERENAFTDLPISLIETIASNMGTAIQNVRLFEETQRLLKETEQRNAELAVITSIQTALASKMDFQGIIDVVGDKLSEIFEDGNVGIALIDNERNVGILPYVVENGKRLEYFEIDLDVPSLLLHTIKRRRPLVINKNISKRFGTEVFNFPELDQRDLKSWLSVPLISGDKFLGGIALRNWQRENAYSESDVRLLQTIANSMSVAFENARLFDETQRLLKETEQRATELQIINNIGQTLTEGLDLNTTLERVGDRLREVLQLTTNTIGIVANDTKTGLVISHYAYLKGKRIILTPSSLGKNLFGIRFAAKVGFRPLVVTTNLEKNWRRFVPDVPEWAEIPKSFVIFPLLSGGELVGSITIADYEKENAFIDLPINMLETIASNLGTAIQNARLFDETQRLLKETDQRATELQIINNIGQTLTEGLDLSITLERVGERLRETLNIKSLSIVVYDPKAGLAISNYFYHYGRQFTPQRFSMRNYKFSMRLASRVGNKPWVVNTNTERYWKKFLKDILPEWTEIPKALVIVPLLAGGELVGSIVIGDYENENAFTDLSLNLLETIASNMGTAIQNVRLFEETKRLFKEAEESRASAEQANKAKSTFLANMSHELRTPLNAIIGFTRIVKKKADGALPEKQIENLDKVLISSEHLLGLINTVLDIAKIEAGRMDVIPSKFSLNTLADQCATLAMPLLKPDVTLEKQVDETLGFIFSDQDKIKQIVLNLLSNAAKFTHAGNILLSVQKVNEENVAISVADSGIGISEDALGRVFEEFQQADNTTTRQYGGTGLGLTISRNLARLLGGDLTAASELGKGSTFILTLPIKYGQKTTSVPDTKPDSSQAAEAQADDLSTQRNNKQGSLKSILIVEDTEFNIDVLTQLLNDDYYLHIAKDGAQGVSMAQENNPDLILMDISLPVIDGYEATRRIREAKISVPIIGLSAHAMSGDAEKAKEAGCNDYMTKPVDEVLLIQKLNQYLR